MPNKLLQPASSLPRSLRVVLYGPENSGKTWTALSFPRPAVFDTEDGSKLYAASRDFFVTLSQSIDDLHAIADYLNANPDEHQTFVLDSISTLYANAVATYTGEDGRVAYDRWAAIHTTFKAIYNRLVLLPCHVVITAHQASRYQTGQKRSIERVGIKPDADDALLHFADIVVRMERVENANGTDRQYAGYFEKIRGYALPRPVRRENIDFAMLMQAAKLMRQPEPQTASNEEK